MNTEELLKHRMLKFRSIGIGGFKEGSKVEPERKRNMKPSEVNTPKFADLESELEDLKKTILESKGPPDPITDQKLKKLEQDLDQEMTKAFISMGLIDRIESLKLELARSPNPDQGLKEKADKIVQEFKRNLSRPGAYLGLKKKLQTRDIVGKLLEMRKNSEKLKNELNQKLSEDIKAEMENLKIAKEKLFKGDPLDENLVREVENAKEKLEEVLKSADLRVLGRAKRGKSNVPDELREEIMKVNKEIKHEIEKVIEEKGLGWKIDEMKVEAAKETNSEKVKKLEAEIKEVIADALSGSPLKQRLENLRLQPVEGNVSVDNGRW
ncbi:acetyl-coenzyme a carboxylase carboxyl transferase subunit alpha chloroplastic [Phtheirospermum japonicum]|uniref:Acetyl-coenzyme a carboxylase carboxyl transferase subunit alpha chloroplastic n=1 Tax=Phtheirospermum japonicum TaxID=374723 RepID=A0A830C9C2_9LAMI|nr:acetyl-coenzyme a carboxylase carboxyl transferase subunit alpha chloroplastic [Phtheirospermum japonicum]